MTLLFTAEEKQYIEVDDNKEYAFYCSADAPKEIKESIEKKLLIHKKWLKKYGR